jgi:hypothetical protein
MTTTKGCMFHVQTHPEYQREVIANTPTNIGVQTKVGGLTNKHRGFHENRRGGKSAF